MVPDEVPKLKPYSNCLDVLVRTPQTLPDEFRLGNGLGIVSRRILRELAKCLKSINLSN